MDVIYKILDDLKDFIRQGEFTNKVTFGEITEADAEKLNIYPFAHLKLVSVDMNENYNVFNFEILVADIVDISNSYDDDDTFYGNDNLIDILNTQFAVIERIYTELRRSYMGGNVYHLASTATAEPFIDKWPMKLAGWMGGFAIQTPKTYVKC